MIRYGAWAVGGLLVGWYFAATAGWPLWTAIGFAAAAPLLVAALDREARSR